MIGMLGKGLTTLGKGTIGAGKLGLKMLFPLWDLEWYGSSMLRPFSQHTHMFKSIYTKPGGFDNMFHMNPKYNFKSLTKTSALLRKLAAAKSMEKNAFTRRVRRIAATLRNIDSGVAAADHILNTIGRWGGQGIALYNRFAAPPEVAPNYGRLALLGTLGGAGLLGLYKLYKDKQEEEKRNMLGNELYNRYLYYRMYPLQKTSSLTKSAGISDIIGSALNSLRNAGAAIGKGTSSAIHAVSDTLGGAAADAANYLQAAAEAAGNYVAHNPVQSTLMGLGAYAAAKDLLAQSGLNRMAAVPTDDELMAVAKYISQADPFLQQVNAGDIYSALKSIAMYNPVIVKDPAAVTSIVKQVISFGGISPDLIKTLTDSYKSYTTAHRNMQSNSNLVSTLGRLFS